MPKTISRTLNITRVSFCSVEVEDGTPRFIPHPDAIFPGQMEKDKAKKLLQGRYNKDTILVITNIDAGQHRYSMGLEDFVLHATITDGAADDDDDDPELPDALSGDAPASGDDDTKVASDLDAIPAPGAEAPVPTPEAAPAPGATDVVAASGGEAAGANVGELPYDDELPDGLAW